MRRTREIVDVTDAVGAELLEISRENFRQRLARARRDLHRFMNDRCGLVNRSNPCRCAKKTRGFTPTLAAAAWSGIWSGLGTPTERVQSLTLTTPLVPSYKAASVLLLLKWLGWRWQQGPVLDPPGWRRLPFEDCLSKTLTVVVLLRARKQGARACKEGRP